MMVKRKLTEIIKKYMFKNKIIIIYGARQVGKTTLVNNLLKQFNNFKTTYFNGDEPDIRSILSSITSTQIKKLIGNSKILFIDEAQKIKNIDNTLKLIVDNFDIPVIVTGSSSFELVNKTSEPLTGRQFVFRLFPLCFSEVVDYHGIINEKRLLKHRLIYGYYPEIFTSEEDKKFKLKMLAESYLFKDILNLEKIKKTEILENIVRALALQIGNEVSYDEISKLVGTDRKTVKKYINLLEKTFVIFKLNSFSRNVRNEIKKSKKIYFYDNGIRNAIVGDFRPIEFRNDAGALWENFIISERIKFIYYKEFLNKNINFINHFFWRTTQQQEIDLIEEYAEGLKIFKFKLNKSKKVKFSKTFLNNYNVIENKVISPDNIDEFLI